MNSPPPPALIARAGYLLAVSWVLVRLWRLDRLLEWLTPKGAIAAPDLARAREAARSVDGILRRLPRLRGRSCLIRSLALYSMSRDAGFQVRFHCGVHKTDGRIDGHAWLTLDEKPFLEPNDPTTLHQVVFSFPS